MVTGPARVVVAAPASGAGKTSVATGLLAAFAARGLQVSGHKVGPDYIDPGYHALAAGRPGRNLDPYLVGEDRIVPLFQHGAATPVPADLAVVEGVMGLFDGVTGMAGFASTAHVATLLRAPVLLVVDATAQGRSVAALVAGFVGFDPAVRIGGVVLNRVGSDRHEATLREALAGIGVAVLGVLRRDDNLATPSRHLGLVPAAERAAEAMTTMRSLGAAIAAGVDLDGVLALARSAPPLPGPGWDPQAEIAGAAGVGDLAGASAGLVVGADNGSGSGSDSDSGHGGAARGPVVAVAGGPAFTFSYAETAELLTAAGAQVVIVDPVRDEALPAGTSGLVLGGGFPELHAEQLSANELLRKEVAELARSGAPVAAECAGLLYLARSLDGRPMCGVLDTEARMTSTLTLGYSEGIAAGDSVLADRGRLLRGHEFHRTACLPVAGPVPAWRRLAAPAEGFIHGNVHASYLHLHWAGWPAAARRFVASARIHDTHWAGR